MDWIAVRMSGVIAVPLFDGYDQRPALAASRSARVRKRTDLAYALRASLWRQAQPCAAGASMIRLVPLEIWVISMRTVRGVVIAGLLLQDVVDMKNIDVDDQNVNGTRQRKMRMRRIIVSLIHERMVPFISVSPCSETHRHHWRFGSRQS